ncbi:MAG: hypothetical protein IKM20_01745 [Erysipelotrichales bacterium]|nr:hypothetical protein [Erysipelotrichales bacterium]
MINFLKQNKKMTMIVVVILAVVAFFTWPISIADMLSGDDGYYVVAVEYDAKAGKIGQDSLAYRFKAGEEKTIELQSILDSYTCHRTLRTLTGDTTLSSEGMNYWIYIHSGKKAFNGYGDQEISLAGNIYHVGYFNNEKATAMINEIREFLETCETVE